jgi:hypothetical protein
MTARRGTRFETVCGSCRGGLICPEAWESWYALAAEVEDGYLAAHGTLDGFPASEDGAALADERPDGPDLAECPACGGSGVLRGPASPAWGSTQPAHRAA